MSTGGSPIEISVVTPTHNRPASLLRLLRSLGNSSLPAGRIEVVVVADGCTDDTAAIARAEPLPFVLRVLEQTPGRGAAAARNLGAAQATGALLVFLDDDIEPGPGLLEEHRRVHMDAGVPSVAIGPPLPVRPARADLGAIAAWAWWEGQFARMGQPGHRFSYDEVFGGILSVPADLFRSVGGFDEGLQCREDGELGFRLIKAGARVLFVPAAGGLHHELRHHARLIQRKRAEGRADVGLARRHPELWHALRLSWPQMPPWHPLGVLRRSAFAAPALSTILIGLLTRALPVLERLRLRGTWRKAQAGVMYGWYWRGIADALGNRRGLAALEAECRAGTPKPEPPLTIDLAHGLEAAEQQVERARPAALWVCFGELEVGLIPPRPGAEPLRAHHLRTVLRTDLAHSLIAVKSTHAAAGHHGVPQPAALRLARDSALSVPLPSVSVVIAAHDAEATIAEALGSLQRQTHPAWEAIVVDDGSGDHTAEIVERYAATDPRIRLLRQARQGPGSARNAGLGLATHPWLLFLDADDWLLPRALERLCSTASALGTVAAVHGGWARVTSEGTVMETEFAPPDADLFHRFAEICAFPIHSCLFRRELLVRSGGFDPALVTCEDWDLWQRLARSGARFGRLTEKVAHYRMQPHSGATATDRLLPDGLEVIRRGHQPDPRVQNPKHAHGAPPAGLPAARLRFASWVAGLLIGRGHPADWVLEHLTGDTAPGLNPTEIANNLFRTVPLSVARGVESWDELWPRVREGLVAFLEELERHSGCWRLAHRTMLALEQLTLDASREARPFVRGSTLAVAIEVTRPIVATPVPSGAERAHCAVLVDGKPIGALLLPVCDGVLAARVLADAIAAEFAWPILRHYFGETRYGELEFVRAPGGISLRLTGSGFGPPAPDAVVVAPEGLHDLIGWTLLLRELWGAPDLSVEDFYREADEVDQRAPESEATRWPVVEMSEVLPRLRTPDALVPIEVRVGGVSIGILQVPSHGGLITQSRLRSAITTETGFELCRVVVREAILGRPFLGEGLRARLAARADAVRHMALPDAQAEAIPASASDGLPPDWRAVVGGFAGTEAASVVLARHAPGALNSPADRRASLPSVLTAELLEAARSIGPPVIKLSGPDHAGRVEYAPELVWSGSVGPEQGLSVEPRAGPARPHDRHHFESLFAQGADPWNYGTPYEQLKYQQTLSLLPAGRPGKALELGCAEGRFTRLLAPRVGRLIAADFSQIALQRAAVDAAPNVSFALLDLATDELPGECDLIICSEVLYYMGSLEALDRVGQKLARALAVGGHLVLAHANAQVDDPDLPGFDWAVPYGARVIGERLAKMPQLHWLREIRTEAYRIQLFQRRESASPDGPSVPAVIEVAPYQQPAAHVAAHFRTGGRRNTSTAQSPGGWTTLPILMYHSIATEGSARTARYRVAPEQFEAQLRYLRGAGFSAVTIHQWLRATRLQQPLPHRSVLLTFDDGYRDFATNAWPLLQRHGFSALVFLVADRIGQSNSWDAALSEPVPLLDWEEIGRLASAGIAFGSHSASHLPMTGLDPTEIAREALRSRLVLERGLGRRVSTFAYPHGDSDAVVQHLVGACGFEAGFTCREARAGYRDPPLALPRIEICGDDDLQTFIAKLGD